MQIKFILLLVAILALTAQPLPGGSVLAQDDQKQLDAPIQTEKKAYKVAVTPRSVKFEINYSYLNRTGGVVFLPSCKKPYRPLLEKKVEGRWTPAVESLGLMCSGPPIRIGPGKTYRNTFEVEAFLPGKNMQPELKIDVGALEGVYRLVHVFSGQNEIFSLEKRVSNEFNLSR